MKLVKVYPTKSKKVYDWMNYLKDGDIYALNDNFYKEYSKDVKMELVESYQIVTTKRVVCPTCGHVTLKRKKVLT